MCAPVAVTVFGLLLCASHALAGAAGDPDPGFGTNGVVLTPVGDVSEAYAMVRQPDGKTVIAGYVGEGQPLTTQFLLARYEVDGTLDAGFGTEGIVRTDVVPGQSSRAKTVVRQPDGKLVAVGFAAVSNYWNAGGDVVVARYLTDGTLDPDFGTGGIVVSDLFGFDDQGRYALVEPDGAIVVAGFARTSSSAASEDAFVARYDESGTLDPSFGVGGVAVLDFGGRVETPFGLARQADGGLIVLATSRDPLDQIYGPSHAILARVGAGGTLDPTFGSGGRTELSVALHTGLTAMVQLPDGDLFASGSYSDDGISGHSILARFDANGTLDVGFGDAGVLEPPPGVIFGLGLAPDGKVLAAGSGFLWGHWQALGATRMSVDGARDVTFGNGGRASAFPGAGTYNAGAFAIVAEPDGPAVTVAGFATDGPYLEPLGEPRYVALARFLAVSTACSSDGDCGTCERCDAGTCANGPRTLCEHPSTPANIMYAGVPVKPRIQWKWKRIAGAPGFDPSTDAVGLCMWWGDIPLFESRVPPGAGWTTKPTGNLVFRDKTRANVGIEQIKVGGGLMVKASGPKIFENPNGFADALLQPADTSIPLHVQLHAGGKCYATTSPQGWLDGQWPSHVRRGKGF